MQEELGHQRAAVRPCRLQRAVQCPGFPVLILTLLPFHVVAHFTSLHFKGGEQPALSPSFAAALGT